MSVESYFHVDCTSNKICLLCNRHVSKNEKHSVNSESSWSKLKQKAEEWSTIDIPPSSEEYEYRHVYTKVKDVEAPFGFKHEKCRLNFFMNMKRFEKMYGRVVNVISEPETPNPEDVNVNHSRTRSTSSHIQSFVRLCFVCQQDEGKKGKIHHCEWDNASTKVTNATKYHMSDSNSRYNTAANRLTILLSGQSHDNFSADIYYHLSCYSSYTRIPNAKNEDTYDTVMEQYLLSDFFTSIRLNIIRDKNAYLLTQLLTDWLRLCEEKSVETLIKRTNQIKKRLEDEFPKELDFFRDGKNVIVYSSTMAAVEYSVAVLKGEGLRDIDLAKGFAAMARKKADILKERNENHFPYSPDQLTEKLQKGPLPVLYNVIYLTVKGSCELNTHGYAKTKSESLATKIWSLAYDWEALLTKQPNPKQVAMGLTIHHVTASKETIQYLHNSNHTISYNQILVQNKAWEGMMASGGNTYGDIYKGKVTHSSIDNNDGRQQTVTGFGTTHHTNSLLFQPSLVLEDGVCNATPADIAAVERNHPGLLEIPYFSVKERKSSQQFPEHVDDNSKVLLEERFERDLIWSIAGGIPEDSDKTLPLLGSWTAFNIRISDVTLPKSLKHYLPVVGKPPDYDVLRTYLEFLVDTSEHLEIKHIFAHADEAVYSKMLHIIWYYGEKFKKVIPLLGGFHQLLVMMSLIYQRHAIIGYTKWFTDAQIIAGGSVDKAIRGKHYYRCIRLHKEAFDAIVELQVDKVTDKYTSMDPVLYSKFSILRENPSSLIIKDISDDENFKTLKSSLIDTTGTQSRMSLAYLKDVSLLLSLVAAARESNIDLHLEAEREMLKLIWAFDHVHYSRYNSFQHVFLVDQKRKNSEPFQDLKNHGFSAARTSGPFKGIHGDLMTEVFNGETKGAAGPFRSGYSTNVSTVNRWVKTIHLHTNLRTALKDKLRTVTSTIHRELQHSQMKRHAQHVAMLKATMCTYKFDFFSDGPASSIVTGEEIKVEILNDVLGADEKGDTRYKTFVSEVLVCGKKSIFDPIRKLHLNTGLKKKKKTLKQVTLLKEDCQAFGVLVSKACSLEEAFKFPLTSVPLSIAESGVELYSADKSALRNEIMKEANANEKAYPVGATWVIDGMAYVRAMKPQATYGEYFEILLGYILPPNTCNAAQIEIIMDTYLRHSAKECTRSLRGEGGIRVHITGFGQHMPKDDAWQQLLCNSENKNDLIGLFASYLKTESVRKRFKIPIIVTEREQTWEITSTGTRMIYECNHEEADTRMVLHALLSDRNCVVSSRDTDVLLLMLYAYAEFDIKNNWYMMYEVGLFANIHTIAEFIGNDVCKVLPQYHALTGCDTTSYFFNAGKIKSFKKMLKDRSCMDLISSLGCDSVINSEDIEDCMKFIQTVVYSGKIEENYVETRVRLYKKQKNKTSRNLPPDPNSCKQAILRAHHQVYQYLRLANKTIEQLPLTDNGWIIHEDEGVIPLWFTCSQLPPSINSRKNKSQRNEIDGHEADDEEDMQPSPSPPVKKKARRSSESFKELGKEFDNDYDADSDNGLSDRDDDWEHLSDFSEDSEDDSDSEW